MPFTSWNNLQSAIAVNPNRHCSLDILQKQTMHIIEAPPEWLLSVGAKGWTSIHESLSNHPITIYCALKDPFFRFGTKASQNNSIRCSLSELSQRFDEVYSKNNGRKRGWIKKDFVAWFLRTEAQDSWTWTFDACLQDKLSSSVCDFISLSLPNITIAVFLPGKELIFQYPISERIHEKVLCIDGSTGCCISAPSGLLASRSEFRSLCSKLGWKWTAPSSVSVPETITELKSKIHVVQGTSLPTMTKQDLMGWIWRSKFLSETE
jgi:hypothetical protein